MTRFYDILMLVIKLKTIKIDQNNANQRIDKFLIKYLPNAPKSFIYKMIRKKDVKINGKRINENYLLQLNDEVSLFLYEDMFLKFAGKKIVYDLPQSFKVLYEDEHILVVDKPSGLLVHEDQNETVHTLTNEVLSYLKRKGEYDDSLENTFTPGPVHRIDRNTSGIVIFGKTLPALQSLNEMMKLRHCIEKKYLTIVSGCIQQNLDLVNYVKKNDKEGKMYLVSKEDKEALKMHTMVHPLEYNQNYSLLEVKIITGRTHQIRIHMASIDHPVIGDSKYGDFELNKQIKKQYHLNHQYLHAHQICFIKPIGILSYLQDKTITCPLPEKLSQIKKEIFNSTTK